MRKLKIVALAGGVGGAKLADGLNQILDPENLTVVVNTADDFKYLGLYISPDLDTVCYTLGGLSNPETGWGRKNETWNVLNQINKNGISTWFQLGDSDLATHIIRSDRLDQGWTLSKITEEFCRAWKIMVKVLPMSDDFVQTWVQTDRGEMEFQDYFVRQKCEPLIHEIKFHGALKAVPAPGVVEAINTCDAIVLCPSNPWVSIDPILSIPGIKTNLQNHKVLAVSPIIGGQTIKGPAAKMFRDFGLTPSALAVTEHYGNIINAIFIDRLDAELSVKIRSTGVIPIITDIIMHDEKDRGRLAAEIVDYIGSWERRK